MKRKLVGLRISLEGNNFRDGVEMRFVRSTAVRAIAAKIAHAKHGRRIPS
jgi:hypothetical protein